MTSESDNDDSSLRVAPTQTLTETTLPWKRDVEVGPDGSTESVNNYVQRQQEFPSWIENRDYLIHGSPTNTLISRLGSANKRVSAPAVFEIFGDESGLQPNASTLRRSSTSDNDKTLKATATTRVDIDKALSPRENSKTLKAATTRIDMASPRDDDKTLRSTATTRIDIDKVSSPRDVVIQIKINGMSPSKTMLNSEMSDDDCESQATRL